VRARVSYKIWRLESLKVFCVFLRKITVSGVGITRNIFISWLRHGVHCKHGPWRFGLARNKHVGRAGRSIAAFPPGHNYRPYTRSGAGRNMKPVTANMAGWPSGVRRCFAAGVTCQQRAASEQLFASFLVENIVRLPPSRYLYDSAPPRRRNDSTM